MYIFYYFLYTYIYVYKYILNNNKINFLEGKYTYLYIKFPFRYLR